MVDEVVPDMKAFIAKAHANDLKVRLYYTCRELTVKTPEFWMLRSLGHEIIKDGPVTIPERSSIRTVRDHGSP